MEHLDHSPTKLRRAVALKVCCPVKPSGKRIKEEKEDEDAVELLSMEDKSLPERSTDTKTDSQTTKVMQTEDEQLRNRMNWLNDEMEWVKKVIKYHKLHHSMRNQRGRDSASSQAKEGGDGHLQPPSVRRTNKKISYSAGFASECCLEQANDLSMEVVNDRSTPTIGTRVNKGVMVFAASAKDCIVINWLLFVAQIVLIVVFVMSISCVRG